MNDLKNIQDKELNLFYKYKQGDKEAKKELINSLTPIITKYIKKYSTAALPKTALELEGMRLVSHAIDTYDPNKSKLNTHVITNLQKMTRFINTYQNVGHIPEPRMLMITNYKNAYQYLEDEKGREPTTEEISDFMKVPVKEVERLQSELRNDLYMGNVVEDEDDTGFFEFINPLDQTPEVKEAIEFVYFDATPEEKIVLEHYFGLYGKPILKSNQIAKKLNISESKLKKIRTKLAKQIKELM